MSHPPLGEVSWERMIRAVENVKERLLRAASALEKAGIPYAVVGGNAVAAWVSRIEEAAVRNTQDVDILLRRVDLDAAERTLAPVGFVRRHVKSIDMFLDGPKSKAREAVHILFAGKKMHQDDPAAAPEVTEVETTPTFRVVTLDALIQMKLTSFHDKDRVHLRDMLGVGLIDETWKARLPRELAERLQEILDTPNG